MVTYVAFLALLACERLVELAVSRRNANKRRGAVEVGAGHFPAMAAMHALFFASCAAEAFFRPFPGALGWIALAAVVCAQALRWWAVLTLGERWNVRILVVPGEAPVTRGPYRFVRHPNYVAVALEILFVPLVHGAWLTALVFSLANALVLRVRIRAEERALGESWSRAFEKVPRFVP